MEDFVLAAARYGYSLLFAAVLAESLGFPIPAAIAVLAAGAAAAQGAMEPGRVLATAIGAMLIGDNVLFFLGRRTGWWLLGVLCRLSLNPESCIARSADSFYRRGRIILVFAKFLPGINTMAPPLAGSMNLPPLQFLGLDSAGILLYIGAYFSAGYLFSDLLKPMLRGYSAAGTAIVWLGGTLLVLWLLNRLRIWFGARGQHPVTMVTPADLADRTDIAIYDVRSHGYYDTGTLRIQGSARLEPNALTLAVASLPRDREIILYCTCMREASAVRVSRLLAEHGVPSAVLKGGLEAWRSASMPVEVVPPDEIVQLPKFA